MGIFTPLLFLPLALSHPGEVDPSWYLLGYPSPSYKGVPELFLPKDDARAVRYLTELNQNLPAKHQLGYGKQLSAPADCRGAFFTALRGNDFLTKEIPVGIPTFLSDGAWGMTKPDYSTPGGGWWVLRVFTNVVDPALFVAIHADDKIASNYIYAGQKPGPLGFMVMRQHVSSFSRSDIDFTTHINKYNQQLAQKTKFMASELSALADKRVAPDGGLYSRDEFYEYFEGFGEWNNAERRIAPDGSSYTLREYNSFL